MKALRLLALAVVIAAPCVARAADLPVSYTVDEKALKAAVAGTNVTFDLYTDSACAGPVVHTETVPIENVELISRLKLGVPKGAVVKPPKTDELRHTLTGVTAAGNLYLTVTGTGIAPVGPACQAQATHVAGGLPRYRVTLRYDFESAWVITEGSSPIGVGNDIVAADAQGAAVLNGFDQTILHTCDIQTGAQTSRDGNGSFFVYGIDNCADVAPSCTDGLKNQDETSTDCGGTICPPCGDFRTCNTTSDCMSGHCLTATASCSGTAQLCVPAHCFDGIKNSGETDIDCGQACGLGCAVGQTCDTQFSCYTGNCDCLAGHTCTQNCNGPGVCQ